MKTKVERQQFIDDALETMLGNGVNYDIHGRMKALVSDIEELQAIVDKLPKTADGVPITIGTRLWVWDTDIGCYQVRESVRLISATAVSLDGHNTANSASTFFSTREAAEAAKEASSKDQDDEIQE